MEYEIHGSLTPVIEVNLNPDEHLYAQSGAMKWLEGNVEMECSGGEGYLARVKRAFTEDGKTYTDRYATRGKDAKVVLGHSYLGNIRVLELKEKTLICQRRIFLGAVGDIRYRLHFEEKNLHFFSQEGYLLNQFVGVGHIMLHFDGECIEKDLKQGQEIKVTPGVLGALEEGVEISKEEIKAPRKFRGEGGSPILLVLTGPGKVWLQASPIQEMGKELHKYLPLRPDPR